MNKQSYLKLASISTKLAALRKMSEPIGITGLDGYSSGIGSGNSSDITSSGDDLNMGTLDINSIGTSPKQAGPTTVGWHPVSSTGSNINSNSFTPHPRTSVINSINGGVTPPVSTPPSSSDDAVFRRVQSDIDSGLVPTSAPPSTVPMPPTGYIPTPQDIEEPVTYTPEQAENALVNRWMAEVYGVTTGPDGQQYLQRKPNPKAKVIMRNRAKALIEQNRGKSLDQNWVDSQQSNAQLNKGKDNAALTDYRPKPNKGNNPTATAAVGNTPTGGFDEQQSWWEKRYETQGANMSPSSQQAHNDREAFKAEFGPNAYKDYMQQCIDRNIQPYGKYNNAWISNNQGYALNGGDPSIAPAGKQSPAPINTPDSQHDSILANQGTPLE